MMRRVLSLTLCGFLALAPASAQIALPFPGPGTAHSAGGGGGCSQSTSYLSGLTTAYTTAYQTMICGMVTDGDFAKLDRFYVLATDASANALKDIITGTTATITGTATFTANNGYVPGTGTLNTTLNYSTATNYKTATAMLMAWPTAGATLDNGCPIGEAAGSFDIYLQTYGFGGGMGGAINGVAIAAGTAGTGTGLFSADLLSGVETSFFNGSSMGTTTAAASAPNNTTAQGFYCAGGTNYAENIAMIAVGASLGSAGQLRVYNRIHTFLNTVNATLFP
jgi:hypothetical protein